jgi:hypothetical protein
LFTPEDVFNSIKAAGNAKVEPIMVADDAFKDWTMLQYVYIKPPTNQTTVNHIFMVDVDKNNGNLMWVSKSDGRQVTELKLVKPQYCENDEAFWNALQPTTINPVGLQDIKWRELHD